MGTDSKVPGHAHAPPWDNDIIDFFVFNNFLAVTIKCYKKQNRFFSAPSVIAWGQLT
jgi:hypothetical protein